MGLAYLVLADVHDYDQSLCRRYEQMLLNKPIVVSARVDVIAGLSGHQTATDSCPLRQSVQHFWRSVLESKSNFVSHYWVSQGSEISLRARPDASNEPRPHPATRDNDCHGKQLRMDILQRVKDWIDSCPNRKSLKKSNHVDRFSWWSPP